MREDADRGRVRSNVICNASLFTRLQFGSDSETARLGDTYSKEGMDMHTINEAAKLIGETYSRVWHAYAYGRVPAPLRVGRTFVLTDTDIDRLRTYFRGDGGQRAPKERQRPRPKKATQPSYTTRST